MTPTEQPRKLPRFCTSIVGPGDPIWHGKPTVERARLIRRTVISDSSGKYYFYDGGTLRRLEGPEAYARLNQILG